MDIEKIRKITQEADVIVSAAAHGLITGKEAKHLKKVCIRKIREYLKDDLDTDVGDIPEIVAGPSAVPAIEHS